MWRVLLLTRYTAPVLLGLQARQSDATHHFCAMTKISFNLCKQHQPKLLSSVDFFVLKFELFNFASVTM